MDRHQAIESEQPKSFAERHKKLAALSAIAAFGVGALTACSTNANAEGPAAPTTTQSAEAPAPSEAPTAPETEPVATVEVEPLSAELSPEELAEGTLELWRGWVLSGATEADIDATAKDITERNLGTDYYQVRALENADIYAAALLGPNWEDDPQMVEYYEHTVNANANTIEDALKKEWSVQEERQLASDNSIKREPLFTIESIVTNAAEAKQEEEGTRTITLDFENQFKNDPEGRTGEKSFVAYKYDLVDGKAYLSGYNYTDFEEF